MPASEIRDGLFRVVSERWCCYAASLAVDRLGVSDRHAQSLDMAREFIETGLAQAGRLSYVTDKCGEISLVRSAARQSETIDRIILY